MVALVRGVSGVVRSVSYADGLVSVDVDGVVVRHRVGARGGIPVAKSRKMWKLLVALRDFRLTAQFSGRPGWAGWFDDVDVSFDVLHEEFEAALALEEAAEYHG